MSGFEEQKEKYLRRTVMERKTEKTITLNYVDNWQEYYVKHLPSLLQTPPSSYRKSYAINSHANDVISLFYGDITKLLIDVIVYSTDIYVNNAHGELVKYNIHEEAGEWLDAECKFNLKPSNADVIITGGYRLPAKYIFHVIEPETRKRNYLRWCYLHCLELARNRNLKTIAIPCISTGVFGYDDEGACQVALETIRNYIDTNPNAFERILFYMDHGSDSRPVYELFMPFYFPVQ